MCQWRFKLDMRRNFFMERMIRHWNGLPKEVFKETPDMALTALVWWTR